MSVSNINSYFFHKINTKGNIDQGRVGEASGGNRVPPQAPAERVAMSVNLAEFSDVEVRRASAQMTQSITL